MVKFKDAVFAIALEVCRSCLLVPLASTINANKFLKLIFYVFPKLQHKLIMVYLTLMMQYLAIRKLISPL